MTLSIAILVILLGAVSRRVVGWGPSPFSGKRILGQAIAGLACLLAVWRLDPLAALVCAFAVPLAYGLPWHGETMNKPILMGLRNGAFAAALALALWLGWKINAVSYIGAGLMVGPVYWAAYRFRDRLPIFGSYLDGWSAYAELGLGACLVGGLVLLSV